MHFEVSSVILLFLCYAGSSVGDKIDELIIACRTTDFDCFKYQYKMVRDKVLLGNPQLGFGRYEPLLFKYGDTKTCVKLSGLEKSILTGIGYDSKAKQFSMTLEMPFSIQQLPAGSKQCLKPDTLYVADPGFVWRSDESWSGRFYKTALTRCPQNIKMIKKAFKTLYSGDSMRKFLGNATIQATFPFELHPKEQEVYMVLKDANLDVVLDIPDLSRFNKANEFEKRLYEQSEWAYNVVQHIDAAQHFAMPYTSRLRILLATVPLHRFMNLYPEEDFDDIAFNYNERDSHCKETV